jgi:hypothetical protein
MDFRGTPPDPACGAPSPHTAWLRPRLNMTAEQAEAARRLKRRNADLSPAQIATQLGDGATEADVRLALATLRMPNPRRTRGTLNATLEAVELIAAESRPGEPRWATLDRLLGELVQRRAVAAAQGRG